MPSKDSANAGTAGTEAAGTENAAAAEPTRRVGVRSTWQREAVSALLSRHAAFISAQDVHAELRDEGKRIGLTTVYRTLQSLEGAGIVDTIRNDGGELLFRRCSDSHHHHLTCRVCGRAVEIRADEAVEQWMSSVAEAHGFADVHHSLELVGVCAECSRAGADRADSDRADSDGTDRDGRTAPPSSPTP